MCAWLFAICLAQAQVPQLISYQAVARDLTGKVLSEKPISVQVEILQGSNQGTAVYTETHELITTKTGTINLLIGGGNPQAGAFAEIDWSKAPYFLRLDMKQGKETEYKEVSNTQMVSVPYALYAEKARTVENTGEENLSNTMIDFIIVPEEGYPEFYDILAGGTTNDIHFDLSVIYLDGKDQEVEVIVSGLPENSYRVELTPSSNNARRIRINNKRANEGGADIPAGTYNVTYTFKNSRGYTRDYNFTYIKKS